MKKALKIIIPLLMIAVIIASIGWYLFVYDRDFTRDMLLGQARHYNDSGNPQLASWFYELAYNYTSQDEDIAIELANQYKEDGNYTKAEFTLTSAISHGGTASLYIALCQTFVEQDKLLDAVNMLNNITNPAIKAELDALRPEAPAASPAPGFYNQYIDVSLSCTDGTLYYSDGTEYPSTGDVPYANPIKLDEGVTVIYSLCVGENGLVSPLSVVEYTVGGVVEPVTFSDRAVELALRKAIGFDETDVVYTNDLWDIKEFTFPEDATSIDDLKYLPYLQQLTLHGMKLDNLDVLASLTYLQAVDLTGCRFPAESLKILANLPELKRINLTECGLSTIADLTGARNLTHLYLANNTLRNLTPLSGMNTLVEIDLDHNAVVDLSAISGLSNLEKLDVSFNSLTSLAPLATCSRINWLDASNNTLETLDGVDKLTQLTHLALDSNSLTDISIVTTCTKLTELTFSQNQVTDIAALASLTLLENLDFSRNAVKALPTWPEGSKLRNINGAYNQIESLDCLAGLSDLSYVYMDYNKIKSIKSLADSYHLVLVSVYGNEIKNVDKEVLLLEERDIIVRYDPT